MMHDSNLSTRPRGHDDRIFWVFVVPVVLIFLFLGIGVTFAQMDASTQQVLGAVPLTPEPSFSVSGGVAIAPIDTFDITIAYSFYPYGQSR